MYKWDERKENEYVTAVNDHDFVTQLSILYNKLDTVQLNDACRDAIVNEFTHLVLTAADSHKITINNNDTSSIHNNNSNNAWFDNECEQVQNEFKMAESLYHLFDNEENRIKMTKIRSKFRETCRSKKKNSEINYAQKLVTLSKTKPKQFWKINKKNTKKVPTACDFHAHFKSMSEDRSQTDENTTNEINNYLFPEIKIDELDAPFDEDELEDAIKSLKTGKAHSSDCLINEFFIKGGLNIKQFILKLFNITVHSESWPQKWAEGVITPVFKKGDNSNATNYRAIVLISSLSKIFTSMINKRLTKWSNTNKIICEEQFGFQKKKSTTDCIFILQSLLQMSFAKSKSVYCAFVDYSCAFDNINHNALWYKVHKTGISSKILNILKDMYSKIRLCVRSDLVTKDVRESNDYFFKPASGVLQGEVVSSYLFSIFINDLPNEINDPDLNTDELLINLLMYADDMCCLSYSRQGLQLALNKLSDYCSKWGLTVNSSKTKCIVFRKNGRIYANDTWTYREENIETVKEFRYLGYTVNSAGSYTNGTKALRTSALKAIFNIKCICQNNQHITPKIQLYLFNTLVKPILGYACEVWGAYPAKPLETIHLKFLKHVLGVRQTTPTAYVYGELGTYPLHIDRNIRIIKYWLKIISSPDTSLINLVYKQLKQETENNVDVRNWATTVKHILEINGFGYIWLNQRITVSEHAFIMTLRQRLTDQYQQTWSEEVAHTSDNRLYKSIKTSFKYEDYLDNIENSTIRKALSKIRLGSHNFMIERGRWNTPKLEYTHRLCTDCNTIEDEFHCFIECPRFNQQRKSLPADITTNPSMWKFITLFKTPNNMIINKLATSCHKILIHYEQFK